MSTTGRNRGALTDGDGLPCSKCTQPANPIYSEQAVYFQCENGHQLALGEIFEREAKCFDEALDHLIRNKEGRVEQIHRMIRDAEARGHFQVAGVLRRQVESIETRLLMLRAAQASNVQDRRAFRPGEKPDRSGEDP